MKNNNNNISQLINKTGEAVLIVLIIFFMGLLIPMLITTVLVAFTSLQYDEVIGSSVIFWLFTIIGWWISAMYINDVLTKSDD